MLSQFRISWNFPYDILLESGVIEYVIHLWLEKDPVSQPQKDTGFHSKIQISKFHVIGHVAGHSYAQGHLRIGFSDSTRVHGYDRHE